MQANIHVGLAFQKFGEAGCGTTLENHHAGNRGESAAIDQFKNGVVDIVP